MQEQLIEPSVRIEVVDNDFIAELTIESDELDEETLRSQILNELHKKRVVFGIKLEILDNLESIRSGEKVVIAEGEYPRHGIDGYVEFTCRKKDPGGTKYYPLNNVSKDEVIAVLYPPHEGKPGRTVRGSLIKQKTGKRARLQQGLGTAVVKKDPLTIRATVDGHAVMYNDGKVEVKPIITFESDINPGMGIIEFIGSMVIRGNVNSGSSITVGKDLMIIGHSRDATIQAGGDIWVREGFIGIGNGRIKANGNITLPHVWNQTVEADGNIELLRESVGGTLIAGGKIIATRARIVGGLLEANRTISVKNLGCELNAHVRVRVGSRGRTMARMAHYKEEIEHTKKRNKELHDSILRLERFKNKFGYLPVDQQGIFEKLTEEQEFWTERLTMQKDEHAKLMALMMNDYDSYVEIHGTLHGNVLIEVNGVRKLIEADVEGVKVRKSNDAIELEGL